MKKILIFISLLLFSMPVYANTNTCKRTKEDLHIPEKVNYQESMYSSIISTPCIDATEKIYDFANLFTEEEEIKIYNLIIDYINDSNLDLAVVTINTNPKSSTMEYADDFYDYNEFKYDGSIFIIDMKNREFYISTSGKALEYYSDYRIEMTLSSMDKTMMNHKYYDSVEILVNKLKSYYLSGKPENGYLYEGEFNPYQENKTKISMKQAIISSIIVALVSSSIYILVLCLRNKQVKKVYNSKLYLNKKATVITKKNERYLNSNTTKTYSPISHDSGGSGHSSGSSFHSGSSGISHGGGGHHF